jgi:hypothetical protein
MKWSASILAGWAVALFMAPVASMAASGGYAAGFYTRGVAAAYAMDQGGAVLDPFYASLAGVEWLPRVTLAAGREDNVFLDPDEPTVGTTLALVPGMLALWGRPSGNHVYADYGLIFPLYESEQELEEKPSHLLRLGAVYRTGKSQVDGQVGFRRMEDVDAAVGARIAKQDFFGDVGVEHRISGKTSLGALGRAERHEFDEEAYADYDRLYAAGRIYRRATAKSQAFFQAGLGRDDPRDVADSEMAADFYDLSLGVRGKQSPKFSMAGRIGYMWRSYGDADREDYENWIASLKAESTPFGLATFSGELVSDIRPAIDATGLDLVDQSLVGSVSRRLFVERVRGNASVTVGRIEYSGRPASAEASVQDGRTDDYWGFALGVDWWTRQNFSLGVEYAYTQRNGDPDAGSADRDAHSYEYGRWTVRASWNY